MHKNLSRIVVGIEYDGTAYKGFQKQKSTSKTIQSHVEEVLSKVAAHKIKSTCSGRTETGVHAYRQVIHFDTSENRHANSWISGGNSLLPKDIRFLWAKKVSGDFHARFSAISRSYRYVIRNSNFPSALERNKSLWIKEPLDLFSMRRACRYLKGENDFTSFRSTSCQSRTPFRNIHRLKISKKKGYYNIDITANAFLLNMMRIIVGTLLEVGIKKISPLRVKQILEEKDRRLAGKTAPSSGLYFIGPTYLNKFRIPPSSNLIS